MRVRTSVLPLLLLASAVPCFSFAADLGAEAVFPSGRSFRVEVQPGVGRLIFDSGDSRPIDGAWDAVLIDGVSPDPGVALELSVGAASGEPGAWKPLTPHRFAGGRFWARADVGAGRTVRIRAWDRGVARAHALEIFGVEAFAAGAEESRGAQPGSAEPPPPGVHGRAEWGAKPPKHPYRPDSPDRITYHHTDGRYTTTLADSLQEVRFIQDFHMNGRGWDDIGYHFLIDAAGNIFQGRPEDVIGAHTENANTDNVGIAFLGMYHPPRNDAITKEALDAFLRIGRYLVAKYGIDPNSLKGHRDYKSTDCPGDELYALRAQLRAELAKPGKANAPPIKPRVIRALPLGAPSFE